MKFELVQTDHKAKLTCNPYAIGRVVRFSDKSHATEYKQTKRQSAFECSCSDFESLHMSSYQK